MARALRLAICDDEEPARSRLLALCERFQKAGGAPLDARAFPSAAELGRVFAPGAFDLLVLDILMSEAPGAGPDGMQLAHLVRRADPEVAIAFVTSAPGFAVEGYQVKASYFLTKPVGYGPFASMLDEVAASLERAPKRGVAVSCERGLVLVGAESIRYVESARNASVIHADGADYRQPVPLSEIERRLSGGRFYRIHSGFLVNVDRVAAVGAADVTLDDGTALPLSKHRRKDFMMALGRLLAGRML